MSDKKRYRKYSDDVVESQEQFDHVLAMTSENLKSKSEIASELAYRDITIKKLESRLVVYERAADVLLKYELFKRPKHWLCRAVRKDLEMSAYTRGKTPEEALKAALKEVEGE